MRLWHQSLIPYLDNKRLLGQHRDCCALRGNGCGRKHATVDYVFNHSQAYLISYHYCILDEMESRGYKYNDKWCCPDYRGKTLGTQKDWSDSRTRELIDDLYNNAHMYNKIIFAEHNEDYMNACLENLSAKGAKVLNFTKNLQVNA